MLNEYLAKFFSVNLNVCSNAAADRSGYKANAGVVFWDVKGKRLSVGLAATGYYVGFGINDKGPRMSGADIALCREFQVTGQGRPIPELREG